jgi:hypothetical protein
MKNHHSILKCKMYTGEFTRYKSTIDREWEEGKGAFTGLGEEHKGVNLVTFCF